MIEIKPNGYVGQLQLALSLERALMADEVGGAYRNRKMVETLLYALDNAAADGAITVEARDKIKRDAEEWTASFMEDHREWAERESYPRPNLAHHTLPG